MVESFFNAIPIVGHVKGTVQLIAGDEKGAKEAYRSATNSTAVATGAMLTAGGAVCGGPGGAIAGASIGSAYVASVKETTDKF